MPNQTEVLRALGEILLEEDFASYSDELRRYIAAPGKWPATPDAFLKDLQEMARVDPKLDSKARDHLLEMLHEGRERLAGRAPSRAHMMELLVELEAKLEGLGFQEPLADLQPNDTLTQIREHLRLARRDVFDFHFRHVGDEEDRPIYEQAKSLYTDALAQLSTAE